MTQVSPTTQIKKVDDPVSWANWIAWRRLYENLARIVNGQLGFGTGGSPTATDNVNNTWANVVTPAAPNTDFVVTHNLQRVVAAYWLALKDRAVDVYTSPTVNADPTHKIILRATVASAVVRLILL